jgi:hypothetical protein
MRTEASISEDGQFRYWLLREWDPALPRLTFVMLNPSTADASKDDPTIRKIVKYAKREKKPRGAATGPRQAVFPVYGGIAVVNLFAYRASKPTDMLRAADPVGPENDTAIRDALGDAAKWDSPVVCAWGLHGSYRQRYREVVAMATAAKVRLVCLGQSAQTLQPFHPLWQKDDAPFVPYVMDGGL